MVNPSDWLGLLPLASETSPNLYGHGPRPVADMRDVHAAWDGTNLYFMVRFWADVNFDTIPQAVPVPGEYVTGFYIEIGRGQNSADML
jgi:hypothetical protein